MVQDCTVTSGMATLSPLYSVEEIAAAREWLIDCFPQCEEDILEASTEAIFRNVAKYFDGGISGFLLTM